MIYLLYGTQKLTIKNRIKKIVKEFLGDVDEMNFIKLDYNEIDIFNLIDEANFLPLGYERKSIVYENCSFITKEDRKLLDDEGYKNLIEYIKNPNPDVDLLLINYEDEIDSKSQIFNLVKSTGKIFSCLTPKDFEWKQFVSQYFSQILKIDIDKDACLEIADRTKYDTELFVNNANKLALYSKHITYDDVCLMVAKPLEDNVFGIMNALLSNKNGKALAIYRDLRKQNNETIPLLITLAASFRIQNEVSYLIKRGYSSTDISSQLKISEGRVRAISYQVYSISSDALNRALEQLYNLDYQIKSGLVDRDLVFELFLINFSTR